uniref:Rad4 beta-hairpin domain-containing protein n=1 Tax=Anopheles atroparvus TaxID=41427 RepID=A0AAG5CQY0_ANOAO
MSDEEEAFTPSEDESDFSASEEDEWVPSKDSKKKKGAKKSMVESSSDEDESEDDDFASEDASDLEDFQASARKKKGNQATARKRPAPKASPGPAAGGKRKRLSPGLRDRLYQQYKKDLLKEKAPVRPPLNSSVSDILQKCQYQRKAGSVGSQSKAEDSDSSGDDHLVDPGKLDLRSTFFNKHEANPGSGGSIGPPQFDVNAGLHLSDSSDGEDRPTRGPTDGEELLPASIPKQAADKLLSHINQQSGEFMNFHNLDQFTAKMEEAKKFLKTYQQQATEHGKPGTAEDNVAPTATQQKESVSNLLALGEMDAGVSPQKTQSNASSDSEWEEVRTGEGQEEGKPETEQKPRDVTIEMDTAQSRRKRREDLEMELYIKRQINKVKRANQLNYHKSSVLSAIAIGHQLNRTVGSGRISGLLLSIMQEKASTKSAKWDEAKVQSLADWFTMEFTLQSGNYLGPRTGCSLRFTLSLALYTRKVICRRDYVLLFLACLRMAGAQARLVHSASVPSKRPAMSDLCPMSERQMKENAEKRLSNCAQAERTLENELENVPKSDAAREESSKPNANVPESAKKEETPPQITPTKENKSIKPSKSTSQKPVTRRTARKALATLNIPQLDGGDDEYFKPSGNVVSPLRRSLRSKSASAVPVESPGSSPFTKRKSNTPGASNAVAVEKSQTTATRKRKLFPPQTEPTNNAVPAARVRSRARKQAEERKAGQATLDIAGAVTKQRKATRQAVRPATPSDDDDFDSKRGNSKKRGKIAATPPAGKGKSGVNNSSLSPGIINGKVPLVVLTDVVGKSVSPAKAEAVNVKKKENDKSIVKKTVSSNDRKVLSSDSSAEGEPPDDRKVEGKRAPSKARAVPARASRSAKNAAARKKKKNKSSSEDSGDNDSDFELPKEPAKRKKKSSPAAAKGKKSPSVRRGAKSGERQASSGDKTDIWIEFYCEKSKRWITFDLVSGRADCVDYIVRNATSPISYVFAWDNEGYLKDITARYVQNWNTACRMLRVEQPWLDKALAPYVGTKSSRDLLEDKELDKLDADKPLPKTIGELKNHPLYALRRHLLKFQALYPAEPPTLGFIRGEAIYPRECVHTLQTREKWYKQGRVVRPFETAYKVVKCWKYDRPTNNWLKDQPCDIFGHWQTDEYDPPTAENGIVPRNEYGNVELFTEKMLPKGTVHLKLPGLNKVCKRLQIDCAPALTGFDMAKMRVVPVYEGFVVCQEFAEQVIEEWYKEMEQEEQREQEKMEKRVYGNWKRLIKGLLVRRKLQNKYNFDNLA